MELPLGRRTRRCSSTTRRRRRWAAAHHAFTRPHDEYVALLENDPGKVLCYRYDLVLNGFEIGGGSIRLHDPEVQTQVFTALGIEDEEAQREVRLPARRAASSARRPTAASRSAWTASRCCSPTESLRDVIPFPKTQKGTDQMTDAPGTVDDHQLTELRIRTLGEPQS